MENSVKDAGKATISVAGKTIEFPVYSGTDGPNVIDVKKLFAETGHFTLDPGFTSTGSCESQITFINGMKGELLHRGYPIDQLAEQADFLEVCYLLYHGELPTREQSRTFRRAITYHTMLDAQIDKFFEGFRRDSHPMAMMAGTVSALSAFYPDAMDVNDPEQRRISCLLYTSPSPRDQRGSRMPSSA